MAESCAMYSPSFNLETLIESFSRDMKHPDVRDEHLDGGIYRIQFVRNTNTGELLEINIKDRAKSPAEFNKMIFGMQAYFKSLTHVGEDVKLSMVASLENLNFVLGIVSVPFFNISEKKVIFELCNHFQGFLFAMNSISFPLANSAIGFYDSTGSLLFAD